MFNDQWRPLVATKKKWLMWVLNFFTGQETKNVHRHSIFVSQLWRPDGQRSQAHTSTRHTVASQPASDRPKTVMPVLWNWIHLVVEFYDLKGLAPDQQSWCYRWHSLHGQDVGRFPSVLWQWPKSVKNFLGSLLVKATPNLIKNSFDKYLKTLRTGRNLANWT